MKFILHRTHTVASRTGFVVEFVAGKATHVPPEMYPDVIAAGGIPEGDLPAPAESPVGSAPSAPDERELALLIAFEAIAARAKRDDFTSGGQPHLKVLAKELGWDVGAKERDLAWVKFLGDKGE